MFGGAEVPAGMDYDIGGEAARASAVPTTMLGGSGGSVPWMTLHDNRLVGKPRKLGSDGGEWGDSHFELLNYLTAMDAQYQEDMKLASIETMPVSDTGSE